MYFKPKLKLENLLSLSLVLDYFKFYAVESFGKLSVKGIKSQTSGLLLDAKLP